MNALITALNDIFADVLAAVGLLVAGEVGQVVIGFTAIGLLLALIVYVKKTWGGARG